MKKYDVYFTYIAEAFCYVDADSEEGVISAVENGDFQIYDEDRCDEVEQIFILDEDGNMHKIKDQLNK